MEQKRELALEEMEMISGGMHDRKENRRYEIFGDVVNCPYCQAALESDRELSYHIKSVHPEYISNI